MYSFTIKDNGADINVVVTRSLLALAGIASLLYHGHAYNVINITAAGLLFAAALVANRLLVKYKLPVIVLLSVAAALVLASTLFIPFALLLVAYGLLSKRLYKAPVVQIDAKGIHIGQSFGNTEHDWKELNNVILKDGLLTLDFVSNKLLQLTVVPDGNATDENSFNNFCAALTGT